jgi:hypothetical protein
MFACAKGNRVQGSFSGLGKGVDQGNKDVFGDFLSAFEQEYTAEAQKGIDHGVM